MITKEKNRTKIICAVVTAISAIVAGGSAFQLYNVQNISQTVNGNVIQILGETGSYVSAGTDLTDSTDELISAYRKVLDENSQYQANQSTLQGQVQSLQNENDDLKNQIQILKGTALREQYIQEKTDSLHKEYVNSLITSVKKELSVRSSTTAVPDIDLYQILMNQHKVQVFHDVVKMIKKPRVIQAQNLYSYRVVAQSSPFSGALAMQKVSRSKTVFSDAFKEYNDPYKFLQVLKGKDIPASEYYKYFVNITYEVFNQYGSPASGGERSEYNLLQELSDGVKNSILILDEPESSFDNIFLRDGVDSLLKDISKTIPVIIATHNNTIGVSVHPDYIVYACKEVLSDGKLEYHLYSGYPSSEDLVDLKGNHISRKSVLLDCLEAGEAAYMDRRNSYEILNG